jgi:hypothetical protein
MAWYAVYPARSSAWVSLVALLWESWVIGCAAGMVVMAAMLDMLDMAAYWLHLSYV